MSWKASMLGDDVASANETIRSRANPLLKRAAGVLAGEETATIPLEGDRLIDDALRAGVELEIVLVSEERADRAGELAARGVQVRLLETELLGRVSPLKTSPGILALAPTPAPVDLARLDLHQSTLPLLPPARAQPRKPRSLARF